jgi:shikimate dehydrogenase
MGRPTHLFNFDFSVGNSPTATNLARVHAMGSYESAGTRLVALLGQPVSYSLSPRMQNAAFAGRGLDWAYVACEVAPERLEAAIRGLQALGFAGANVTIPHKQAAAVLCDEADGDAVNTLVFRDGLVLGCNTDREILRGIEATRACLIGAGGAATALLPGLPAETRVFSRRGDWPPDARDADLVVNATPVTDELLVEPRAEQAVVDLAYRSDGRSTALADAARTAGCREVVDGLQALVRQGAASFECWTGVAAPVEVMRAALGLPP